MKHNSIVNVTKKEIILREIEQMDDLFEEILDFVHFLKIKSRRESLETAIASESSLKKEWLRPEEDEAWQDL